MLAVAPCYPLALQDIGTTYIQKLYCPLGTLVMKQSIALGAVRNRRSATKTLQEVEEKEEEEEARAAQKQAAQDDQAFQGVEEGTHSSEQVQYIHNLKRETATQGGVQHLAHKPARLFETEGAGVEQATQDTTDQPAACSTHP